MAALTLAGAFGVDVVALARRVTDRQNELGRDDAACATIAGVTVERWRAWKEGREVPGVGRVPNLAAALDSPAAWVLYGATATSETQTEPVERSTTDARRVLELLARLVPAVDVVESIAEEIERARLIVPGAVAMANALDDASITLRANRG